MRRDSERILHVELSYSASARAARLSSTTASCQRAPEGSSCTPVPPLCLQQHVKLQMVTRLALMHQTYTPTLTGGSHLQRIHFVMRKLILFQKLLHEPAAVQAGLQRPSQLCGLVQQVCGRMTSRGKDARDPRATLRQAVEV